MSIAVDLACSSPVPASVREADVPKKRDAATVLAAAKVSAIVDERLGAIAAALPKVRGQTVSRSEVVRLAIERGIEVLESELGIKPEP
jgi:hypothetical protein